ncbi:MAG TPA: pentapeptide repeat-containing protein [Allosphingosinicella sp.]
MVSRSLKDGLDRTLQILTADTHSLKDLAYMSGYDPATFYRHSDLSGLDLSGQDLRGLNFEGADLRNAKLDDVIIDAGAMNLSRAGPEAQHLRDAFDCYFGDVDNRFIARLGLMGRLRKNALDSALLSAGVNADQVQQEIWKRGDSVRHACDGKFIRLAELSQIYNILTDRELYRSTQRDLSLAVWNQPVLEVARKTKRSFVHVTREEFYRLLDEAAEEVYRSNLAIMHAGIGNALRSAVRADKEMPKQIADLLSQLDGIILHSD